MTAPPHVAHDHKRLNNTVTRFLLDSRFALLFAPAFA